MSGVHVLRGPMAEPPALAEPAIPLRLHIATDPDDEVVNTKFPAGRVPYARKCLSLGDRAYIALSDDDIVGWSWIAFRSHRDPSTGLRIRLDPGDAYSYDSWVHAEHRKNRVFQFLFSSIYDDLRLHHDKKRMVGYVLIGNEGALKASAPYGLSEVQTVRTVHALGRWGLQLPFSDRPRRGPCSRQG